MGISKQILIEICKTLGTPIEKVLDEVKKLETRRTAIASLNTELRLMDSRRKKAEEIVSKLRSDKKKLELEVHGNLETYNKHRQTINRLSLQVESLERWITTYQAFFETIKAHYLTIEFSEGIWCIESAGVSGCEGKTFFDAYQRWQHNKKVHDDNSEVKDYNAHLQST